MPLSAACVPMKPASKDNRDVLVLSPDSDFFRYMKSPDTLRK